MRILVTGACGQLGTSLRPLLPDAVFTDIVEAPGTRRLDITDLPAIRTLITAEQIDCIVNCAAFTNVDAAEDQPELAELLNAKAVENLAVAMREAGGFLLHISTDYVFGGESLNTPIRETQSGKPTGVYGLTKLHGEEAIRRTGVRSIILRTAWLYSEFGKNFVKTMLRLTAERPSLKVVFDQVGTPTYAGDLAHAIVRILHQEDRATEDGTPAVAEEKAYVKENGTPAVAKEKADAPLGVPSSSSSSCRIFHYTNEGVCSWYDFAKAIAAYAGHTGCEILPCHSDEFPSKVVRPAYSVLDKTLIKESFSLKIPYWTDALQRCLKGLQQG